MKLKLFSDFRDYYDHMFDISGEPFLRFSIDMLTKREQLILLTAAGYKVPQHGILEDLFNAGVGEKFVVYYKPTLHAGKGKTIIYSGERTILLEGTSAAECKKKRNNPLRATIDHLVSRFHVLRLHSASKEQKGYNYNHLVIACNRCNGERGVKESKLANMRLKILQQGTKPNFCILD